MSVTDYIEEHCSEEPEYLREIWRETNVRELNGRMVCGRAEGRLLALLSKLMRPRRILELGTFTGYSALCLAEGLAPDGWVDTVEIDDELEETIIRNLARTPLGKQVRLHLGDCASIVPQLARDESDRYDIVFLDADKRRYQEDLELVLPLVRPGGLIVADNTLWSGKVLEVTRTGLEPLAESLKLKDRQLEGIVRFNELVAKDERLECVQLPLRDGICFLRKK